MHRVLFHAGWLFRPEDLEEDDEEQQREEKEEARERGQEEAHPERAAVQLYLERQEVERAVRAQPHHERDVVQTVQTNRRQG